MSDADRRIMKLMKWINRHEEDWTTICGCGKYPIDYAEYIRLHRTLMFMDCPEITLVLLTHHMYAVQDIIAERLQTFIKWVDDLHNNDSEDNGFDII